MDSLARKIEVRAVFQQYGEIAAIDGEGCTVRTPLADVSARRAASCLLVPAVGDRVLLAVEDGGDAFVLAVLEQRDPAAATVAVEGDLTLRSLRGKVTVAAQEGIDLVTAAALQVAAATAEVTVSDALTLLGGAVRAEVGKIKLVASTFDSFLERFSQTAKRSYRVIEEIDHVKAAHLDYEASANAHIRAKNALVTAQDLVKLDGAQIHIG